MNEELRSRIVTVIENRIISEYEKHAKHTDQWTAFAALKATGEIEVILQSEIKKEKEE